MKLIKRLLIFIITLVAILGVAAVGSYVYVRKTYDIDLFNTPAELKKLNTKVDEEKLCPNAYTSEDKVNIKDKINLSFNDTLSYTKADGLKLDLSKLNSKMKTIIKLTDREIACLADETIKEEADGKITIASKDIPIEIKQIEISNVNNGNANINIVFKLDIKDIKSSLPSLLKYLKKYIPDDLYVSSTFSVTKTANSFAYELAPVEFKLNNLNDSETKELMDILNLLFNFGSSDDFNLLIAKIVMQSLVGDENNQGFAYSLKAYGAKDFKFINEDENNYFSVVC